MKTITTKVRGWVGFGLAVFLFSASARAQVAVGEFAPDFELTSLAGETVRLSDFEDRVLVLEWTSHLCPAVARFHDSRLMADTRGAVESEDVAWLQLDSSWFAPNVVGDIQAWRQRQGLADPYLLDANGRVARAYGAQATPHLFVIGGDGVVAYSGALHNGAEEDVRRNLVVEAVEAVLSGEEPPISESTPVGCTIKFGEPREAATPAEIDGEYRGKMIYLKAVKGARKQKYDDACALFQRSIREGLRTPWQVVADDAFAGLLALAGPREEIRATLNMPAKAFLTMVAPSEPGRGLVIWGTVHDPEGRPIAGATVSLYHTDAAGYYSAGSTSGENARLFGAVATDESGHYRIRTVLPGHYADSGEVPMHVHMGARARGHRPAEGHAASLYFEDDPALAGANLEEIRSDGCSIRPLGKNAEGVALVVHDIVLQPE